jgi:dimethylhistidine N-methyltransferase
VAGRPQLILVDVQRDALQEQFRSDVLAGLGQPQRAIPARWLYDHAGSELFDQITRLPEYYPTRTETSILTGMCGDISQAVGKGTAVVEFGAGSVTKTPLLLDCIKPAGYIAIDISGDYLHGACETLALRYPALPIVPVEADFTQPVPLPKEVAGLPLLGFFPGSTIGNFTPADAVDLLRAMRETLGDGSRLLIGFDLIKDADTLIAAYDDAAGVTAAFNCNLAARINRELDGIIPLEELGHRAIWNADRARIEMHLVALSDISFEVAGRPFSMRAGETIHTENSHKYSVPTASTLLLAGGWDPVSHYSDPDRRFMVVLANATGGSITA